MPPCLRAEVLNGLPHGFFGRRGGVSEGLYDSLNCGLGSADSRAAVMENRRLAAAGLGLADGAALVSLHQIHSPSVVTVETPWAPGQGPRADAMVTRCRGLALGVLSADCAPVLLADRTNGVIGAAHAGWRGAQAGVVEATVAAMIALGARRDAVAAAVGPCIGAASYEVGVDFAAAILADDPEAEPLFSRAADAPRPHFDLAGYVALRLARAGVATIGLSGRDTAAEPEAFFSYRRTTHLGQPDYGREISAIMLD